MKQLCVGIHCHEQPELLHETVESLRRNTSSTVELILLPDGPDTRMRQALQGLDHIPQSGTAEPSGTAACFNRLANSTRADIVVLLEGGAQVGPSWLDHLLAALDSDPRNGLAGPSTNNSWNEQCVFPRSGNNPAEIATTAMQTEAKFGNEVRTLEPLYSLADFCYAVRREVIEAVGAADEGYSLGPCWEMDYNIRAARAGWRGVWACAAYVHRAPFTARRKFEEARRFQASKRRYQDKFCGARLRGEKSDYRFHCRGDACPNFAPRHLFTGSQPVIAPDNTAAVVAATPSRIEVPASETPLVSCIMPTCDRLPFVLQAVRCFLKQDYNNLELVIVDDGTQPVAPLLPKNDRIRIIHLDAKKNVGAKRNLACQAARGQFILHWDDDDWYPRDRIRRQMAALQSGRTEICGTSTLFYYEASTGRAWCYRYGGGQRGWVAGNTLAYRKSWWAAHPFPEIQVGEDTRFVWAAAAAQICDLASPGLCVARVHAGNTSRKQTHSACWQPRSAADLQSLLGADWSEFAGSAKGEASGRRTSHLTPDTSHLTLDTSCPLVSCIMPTCNRRAFLPLALQAFLAQDYPSKELVIVEDGAENVSDLVRDLEAVRYIRLERRESIGRKRNLACQSARGSIIAHWDDDDWCSPQRLRHQMTPLLAGQADLTGLENSCQLELDTGAFWRTKPELHRKMFVGDVHGGTLVYWRSLFDQGIRYPEINLAEDALFLRQALQRGKRLLRLDNPGVFVYVRHGRNSWRFQGGRFRDSNGWERVNGPPGFSCDLLAAYRAATGQTSDLVEQSTRV